MKCEQIQAIEDRSKSAEILRVLANVAPPHQAAPWVLTKRCMSP